MAKNPVFATAVIAAGLALGTGARLSAAFEVHGDSLPFPDGTVNISRQSIESRTDVPVLTAQVTNQRVTVQVNAEPGLYTLQVGELTTAFVAFRGERLRMVVSPDRKNLRVVGGHDQELFAAYEEFRAESLARNVTVVREAIAAQRAAGNEAEAVRLTEAEVAGYRKHRRELNDFTITRLRGSPALYAASLRWDGDYRLDDLAETVKDYAQRNPGLEIAGLMEERVRRFRAVALGAVAPSLAGTSPTGVRVSLDALRGRYVLVDFWASWCAPCRVENRNYTQLYQRHRGAGFEILAVSVDENESAWKAAIAKDSAQWLQISDLKGWQSPLAGAYNVAALPASFLLDPQGRIVAKDLRGKQLAERLASLLSAEQKP